MKKMLYFIVALALAAPFAIKTAAASPQQIQGLYDDLVTLVDRAGELSAKAYRLEYNMDGDSNPNKRELAHAAYRNAEAQVGGAIKRLKNLGQSRDDIAARMSQPLSEITSDFQPDGLYKYFFVNLLNEFYI